MGIGRSSQDLGARIEARYAEQMAAGFLAEVAALRSDPRGLSRTAAQALGYKELLEHLEGRASLEEALRPGGAAHPPVRPAPAGLVPP